MKAPTAMTCSAHRWTQRGSARGHTSKSAKAAAAESPTRIGRRKSANAPLFHPCIIRSPTSMDIVSATPTRRAVFARSTIGFEDTVMDRNRVSGDGDATGGGFAGGDGVLVLGSQ